MTETTSREIRFAPTPQAAYYAGLETRAKVRFVRRRTSGVPTFVSLNLAGRDEIFLLEIEDGFVYLRHPRWSWVGVGGSVQEAERDLLEEIQRLAVVMSDISPSELTPDGLEFRHFALSFL